MESQPQNPEFRNNPENFHTLYQFAELHLVLTHYEDHIEPVDTCKLCACEDRKTILR